MFLFTSEQKYLIERKNWHEFLSRTLSFAMFTLKHTQCVKTLMYNLSSLWKHANGAKRLFVKPKITNKLVHEQIFYFEYLFRKTIYHIGEKTKREYKNPLQVPVRKCSKSKNCDNNISTRINDNRKT